MIEPPRPPSFIRRAAVCAPNTCAFRLSRSMRSHPSSVTSSHSAHPPAIEGSPPALFTHTSSRPNVATAASPTARRWARSVTSPARTTARRPSDSISARSSSRSSRVRAVRTRSAPCAAYASAIARPRPRLEPVTTQVLPLSVNMWLLLHACCAVRPSRRRLRSAPRGASRLTGCPSPRFHPPMAGDQSHPASIEPAPASPTPATPTSPSRGPGGPSSSSSGAPLATTVLAALGIVYGDSGTSPLYSLRECFFGPHAVPATADNVLGILSLITWSLILVVSVKYLLLILRADNDGEGGILALMALATGVGGRAPHALLILGLFGAALLYGDGMITPAISVLSAVEGLAIATKGLQHVVVPLTIAVLVGLFSLQRRGTGAIGALFGPVTLTWFAVIAVL